MLVPRRTLPFWLFLVLASTMLGGCVESPVYRLWYRKQWEDDEKYGPTLFTRLDELKRQQKEAKSLDPQQQAELARRLVQAIDQDPSVVYRAEAARTLGVLPTPLAIEGLHRALGDEDASVRIAACQSWGKRGDTQAILVLEQVVKADRNLDVRMAATRALGKFKSPETVQALAVALNDPDPALQFQAVESLKRSTGEDFGNSIPAWRQYVRGEPVDVSEPPSVAERLRSIF